MSSEAGSLVYHPDLEALQASLAPPRKGPRARMAEVLPFIQLDQWPPEGLVAKVLARAASLPDVMVRQSRMASPETAALALLDEFAVGPAEAFIDLSEFCHLHAAPQGGILLTLPELILDPVIDLGWGELHPAAQTGSISPCLVAVYAPRDEREVAAALTLVEVSWRFARDEW